MQHILDNLLYITGGALIIGYISYKIKARRRYLRQVVSIVGGHPDELKFVNILEGMIQAGELTPMAKTA